MIYCRKKHNKYHHGGTAKLRLCSYNMRKVHYDTAMFIEHLFICSVKVTHDLGIALFHFLHIQF